MTESKDGTKLVLLVEDNPHDQQVYGDLLWYNGYDVVAAATAEEGYRLAHEGPPALIILDLTLPDGDGLELCRRLKAEPSTASVPVIILSARDREPYAALTAQLGCAAYLQKPIDPLAVVTEIMRLVGAPPKD